MGSHAPPALIIPNIATKYSNENSVRIATSWPGFTPALRSCTAKREL